MTRNENTDTSAHEDVNASSNVNNSMIMVPIATLRPPSTSPHVNTAEPRPGSIFANGTGIQPLPSLPGSPQSPPRLETPSPSPFVHVLPLPETNIENEADELPSPSPFVHVLPLPEANVDDHADEPSSESPFIHVSPLADHHIELTPQDSQNNNNVGDAMETDADNWEITANPADWGIPENTEETEELFVFREQPLHSWEHQRVATNMRRMLSRLLSLVLPLTALKFGSRTSHRPLNRLRELIPPKRFRELFPEFRDYSDLARYVSPVRENQRKIPNCWQPYLPCLQQIRILLARFIDQAENLVKHHSDYYDGLKEFVCFENVDYWHAEEQGNGILHTHESQYLYALARFLTDQEFYDLAKRTRQLLACQFERSSDLWMLTVTILDRLQPPSYDFELDCGYQEATPGQRELFRNVSIH